MPRACNPNLMKDWKIPLDATLAGAVEFRLMDPVTKKPRYGERSKLISWLLAGWLSEMHGLKVEVEPPSADLLPERKPQ